jgi:hypothetical protein
MMHGQQNIKNGWATIVVVGRLRVNGELFFIFNFILYVFFTVHFDTIVQHKPTKNTVFKLMLWLDFRRLLHVSNLMGSSSGRHFVHAVFYGMFFMHLCVQSKTHERRRRRKKSNWSFNFESVHFVFFLGYISLSLSLYLSHLSSFLYRCQILIPFPRFSVKNSDLVSAVGYVKILWREKDIKLRHRWQISHVQIELAYTTYKYWPKNYIKMCMFGVLYF